MKRLLTAIANALPQSLTVRLPLLVILSFILGLSVAGWTMQNMYKRSIALTEAQATGAALRDLLAGPTWAGLPTGGQLSDGPYTLTRVTDFGDTLPSSSVALILTLENVRIRAAVAFDTPPKLPEALSARNETQAVADRLAELSHGIARQDQEAHLYVFITPQDVLIISAPNVWQSRPGQTWVALFGIGGLVLCLSLVTTLAVSLAAPISILARRGAVNLPKDPLISTEAFLIRDKIARLMERFEAEQQTKERNLAAISHDLRTPVTRLRLRNELLTDDVLRERFEHDLDELSGLIDGALDLLGLGSQPEESFQFSLASLLESLVYDYTDTGKNVSFITQSEIAFQSAATIFASRADLTIRTENECQMRGQPDKLRRAFSNFIDNALKYGGRAEVEVKPHSADMISVTIRDFGPGIEPDQLSRVQLPFVRGHAHHGQIGAGLGLSIATELIELHGGTLEFTNVDPGLLVKVLVSRGF